MAYSDHPLVDDLKKHFGDADMTDEQLQDHADGWLVRATPEERKGSLARIREALHEEDTSTQLSKKVCLLQLERQHVQIDRTLKHYGR